ncbi:hypothetical protein [Burkholderia gladioli]|uniref:hypothetical protein n=1 Tax=Burkholderia gladioli TaxID=28095 RepID=UPI001FC8D9F4|nr:hypothetical protein [Burkholderia gladioli]
MTNNTTAYQDALMLVHEEAGRTLSKSDFDLCMRIAKRALLTSPRAAGLPEGWKLVPIEPTQKMLDCWWDGLQKGAAFVNCTPRGVYGAMLDAAPAAPVAEAEPIPMLLFCPRCGTQHIDAPESEPGQLISGGPNAGRAVPPKVTWTNPPHRSHLCHACGIVWRPADVATVGVEAIETSGKADTWTKETPWIGHNWVAAQAVAANGAACQGKNCGATDGVSHSPKCVAEHEAAVTGAVAADGEAADDLLQLDVLLANLHAAVWHAGAGDDGPVDYDMAGKDEAKAIQRHVRAMLAERAAVSPATAEKVYYGGSVEAGPVAFDEPATADERAAFEAAYAVKWNAAYGNKTSHTAADVAALREGDSYGEDRTYLNAMWEGWQARTSQAAAPQANAADARTALRWTAGTLQEIVSGRWKGAKESDKVSIGAVTKTVAQVLDMADAALGVASQAAAPADARSLPDDVQDTLKLAIGYIGSSERADRHEHVARIQAILVGAAPAEAREPSAWVTPEGDRSITQSQKQGMLRDGGAGASSVQPFSIACYAGAVPADAGEAVLTAAARDVLAERARQVSVEGWTLEHDDAHDDEELTLAAIVYAESAIGYHPHCPDSWPWSVDWFKPTTPRRDRVKAVALLLAAIERIDRAEAREKGAQGGKGGEA